MSELWSDPQSDVWQAALDRYPAVVASQGVKRLPALDQWYREELPARLASRAPSFLTAEELTRVTEWKMARGVWRQRNLILVRSNEPTQVEATSCEAFRLVPEPTKPLAILSRLAGVGPATASAVLAAFAPAIYPFFDDLVASQIPDLGPVDFTARTYARYADALRERARRLGSGWTPTQLERALWAHVGGKAGPAVSGGVATTTDP